jgi:DSF synthase
MNTLDFPYPPFVRRHEALTVEYDAQHSAVWTTINNHRKRAVMSRTLLNDIATAQRAIQDFHGSPEAERYPMRFLVTASSVPNVYNLGGDLELFTRFIREQDRDSLREYAHACVRGIYQNVIGLGIPLTTIALVEGSALGGGFEAALSCDVIVAERGTEFGFPEVLFNLFPGMGAYSLLARRVPVFVAERIITNGRMYKAEELYDLGIVDVLANRGDGRASVEGFMRQYARAPNGRRAMREARERIAPVSYRELIDVVEIWVDAALRLEKRDLRLMQRLVRAQDQNAVSGRSDEVPMALS